MLDQNHAQLSEIARRLENVARIGTVEQIDYPAGLCRVRSGEVLSDWLPLPASITANSVGWSPLAIGTQVLIASESGDLANAQIVQTFYNDVFAAPNTNPNEQSITFADGAVLSYNSETSTLTAQLPSTASVQL